MRRTFFITLVLVLSGVLSSCAGDPDHRVLFIGNSYTHTNNMPSMVQAIANANGVAISTDMIAPGGAFLHEHLANSEVIDAIRSGNYDVVVFQEQSVIPSVPSYAQQQTVPAAVSLDQIADESGVRVIWFQTWGHLNGFPSEGHGSYESMQSAVNDTYDEIGRRTGAPVARAGEAFGRARESVPVGLYHQDGTHPSPAGSYLAAIQITETITLMQVADAPSVDGVDEATADALAAV